MSESVSNFAHSHNFFYCFHNTLLVKWLDSGGLNPISVYWFECTFIFQHQKQIQTLILSKTVHNWKRLYSNSISSWNSISRLMHIKNYWDFFFSLLKSDQETEKCSLEKNWRQSAGLAVEDWVFFSSSCCCRKRFWPSLFCVPCCDIPWIQRQASDTVGLNLCCVLPC